MATCQVCEDEFEAQRSSAKYCGERCKKRAQRGASKSGSPDLEASVRKELEAASRVDSFAGQLAIELARQLAAPGATGIGSLSKELRTVMAAALEGVAPPSGESGDVEDEVDKARKAREHKARQAAGRS